MPNKGESKIRNKIRPYKSEVDKINNESQMLLLGGIALVTIIAIIIGLIFSWALLIAKLDLMYPMRTLAEGILVLFAFLPFFYNFLKSFIFAKTTKEYRNHRMHYLSWAIIFIISLIKVILSLQNL